jgi:hypothetical protein
MPNGYNLKFDPRYDKLLSIDGKPIDDFNPKYDKIVSINGIMIDDGWMSNLPIIEESDLEKMEENFKKLNNYINKDVSDDILREILLIFKKYIENQKEHNKSSNSHLKDISLKVTSKSMYFDIRTSIITSIVWIIITSTSLYVYKEWVVQLLK